MEAGSSMAVFFFAAPRKKYKLLALRWMTHCSSFIFAVKAEFMTAYRLNFHKEINAQPIWMSEFLYP